MAKRGDIGGAKAVYRDLETYTDYVVLREEGPPSRNLIPLLNDLVIDGKIVKKFEDSKTIRENVINKLKIIKNLQPKISYGV